MLTPGMNGRAEGFRHDREADAAMPLTEERSRVGLGVAVQESLKTGVGYTAGHYGELFQGQIQDGAGQLRRCLLSLPCSSLYSRATFVPLPGAPLEVEPRHKPKARIAVELVLEALRARGMGGRLLIDSNVPEAKGNGSSTCDCVSACRAVSDALGHRLRDEEVARLVVQAEIASDNTMFDRAVLFAQREGTILEDYAVPVPQLEVLGVDTDAPGYVDTVAYPPAVYSRSEIQSFDFLSGVLRRALITRDVRLLGTIATASAAINERFLPKQFFAEIRSLAARSGALGVAAAHSGTVLGILLDPWDALLNHRIDILRNGLATLGVRETIRFQTQPAARRTEA